MTFRGNLPPLQASWVVKSITYCKNFKPWQVNLVQGPIHGTLILKYVHISSKLIQIHNLDLLCLLLPPSSIGNLGPVGGAV